LTLFTRTSQVIGWNTGFCTSQVIGGEYRLRNDI